MNAEKIGTFIKELRTNEKLTQKELAKKLKVPVNKISKWENGKEIPDVSLVTPLADILRVSEIELLEGERLDNNESNKVVKETLDIAKVNERKKVNKIYQNVCLIILLFIIFHFSIFFITKSYYLNKKYYFNDKTISYEGYNNYYDYIKSTTESLIDEKITLIKNNQGNYTDEEYQNILKSIKDIEKILWTEDVYLKDKNYITLKELVDDKVYENYFALNDISIYNTIFDNHNYTKENIRVYGVSYIYWYRLLEINNNIYDDYFYNTNDDEDDALSYLNNMISCKYAYIKNMLDIIINVGEINE